MNVRVSAFLMFVLLYGGHSIPSTTPCLMWETARQEVVQRVSDTLGVGGGVMGGGGGDFKSPDLHPSVNHERREKNY